MKFKPGDKVFCIKAGGGRGVVVGRTFTVKHYANGSRSLLIMEEGPHLFERRFVLDTPENRAQLMQNIMEAAE